LVRLRRLSSPPVNFGGSVGGAGEDWYLAPDEIQEEVLDHPAPVPAGVDKPAIPFEGWRFPEVLRSAQLR